LFVFEDNRCLFALLSLDLTKIEFQLFAFKDITIGTADLSGSRRQACCCGREIRERGRKIEARERKEKEMLKDKVKITTKQIIKR